MKRKKLKIKRSYKKNLDYYCFECHLLLWILFILQLTKSRWNYQLRDNCFKQHPQVQLIFNHVYYLKKRIGGNIVRKLNAYLPALLHCSRMVSLMIFNLFCNANDMLVLKVEC